MSLTGISPPSSDPSNVLLSVFFRKPVRIVQKFGSPRGPGKKAPKEQETGYGAVTTVRRPAIPFLSPVSVLTIGRPLFPGLRRHVPPSSSHPTDHFLPRPVSCQLTLVARQRRTVLQVNAFRHLSQRSDPPLQAKYRPSLSRRRRGVRVAGG